jgi:AcrR family transcriptional regulator
VNEVTLFRLFGSKEALLEEAIASSEGARGAAAPLPAEPGDPLRELAAWCRAELAQLREGRALIRKCFADTEEHPNHVRPAAEGMNAAAEALRAYVGRLAKTGRVTVAPRQRDTAVAMLLASLMADALGRDEMGAVFRVPEAEAPRRYAAMFLGALGISSED